MVLAAFDGFPILAALLTGVALLIFSGGAAVWNGPIASGWRAGARSTLRAGVGQPRSTRRDPPPGGMAMRRRFVVLLAASLVFAACQAENDVVTGTTSAPSTTISPSTIPSPTTTAVPISPPTTPATTSEMPEILLADGAGIRLVGDAGAAVVFTNAAATLAVPDLVGGVVFQGVVSEPTGLGYDESLGRNVFEWADGGPEPIWHLAAPGAEAVAVVTHPDARLDLVDVVEFGGHPTVLYRMLVGGPGGDEAAWYQVFEWLCLFDMVTGHTQMLGLIGSYESSITQMRLGGDLVAVGFDAYAESFGTQIGFVPTADLSGPVEYAWLPRVAMDHLMYGPAVACEQTPGCHSWARVTAASDGSRISWVQGGVLAVEGGTEPWPTEVVTLDRASGEQTTRFELGAAAGNAEPVRFVDDDGSSIVISGVGVDRDVMVIGADDVVRWMDVPGATASLWQSAAVTVTDPIVSHTTLALRGDGLGVVMFGAPLDAVAAYLEVEAGPPSSEYREMYHVFECEHLGLTMRYAVSDDGVERFVGWSHWPGTLLSPLRTSRGIGVGDTLGDLLAAHGDAATIVRGDDECMPSWYVEIAEPSNEWSLIVEFDGSPDDPSSPVSGMWAGATEGC